MMAVTIFCQDAREEVGGIISLMGILPDDLRLVGPPMLPKLVIYTRINVPAGEARKPLYFRLQAPNGENVINNAVEEAVVQKAIDDARAAGNPIAGLVTRIEGSPFPAMPGRYVSLVKWGDAEEITGSINIQIGGIGTT